MITPKDDPIVHEISDVLREWSFVWKRLYAVSLSVLSTVLVTCSVRCTLTFYHSARKLVCIYFCNLFILDIFNMHNTSHKYFVI